MSSEADHSPATGLRAASWSGISWSDISTRVTHWRNWSLATKFAAVVLVPVIVACALGVLQIKGQIRTAEDYEYLGTVVETAESVRESATLLQEERTRAADILSGGATAPETVQEKFRATDAAWDHSARLLRAQADSDVVVGLAHDEVDRKLDEIRTLRQQVIGGRIDPMIAVDTYSDITRSVLALDRTLIGRISSSRLAPTATSLHEIAKITHELRLQEALILVGLNRESLPPIQLGRLGESETRRLSAVDEFRAAATPSQRLDYDQLYFRPEVSGRATVLSSTLASTDGSPPAISVQDWETRSRTELDALGALRAGMDAQLRNTTSTLHENASNAAGFDSVLLLSALLIAGAIVVMIARQLLGSLTALRRSALEAATRELPQAVAAIRSGTQTRTALPEVPVHTTEEVGQVARAFDDVHTQAVTLASEQAELRRSHNDSFVNVSRRSQSLLERQLRLFEQLERDEEDPDQLSTLFQLDHLATRMRRNNENLMVLAGSDLTRRFTQPASPADLIRAAVSEIEHYPRVVVQPLPNADIVGYVANDLVRLLAELLDNAANFSAPHTTVTVTAYRHDSGDFDLDIVDAGIGMDDVELGNVNRRLSPEHGNELSTSRRMGLFVVRRLAIRHNFGVRLHHGPNGIGLRATITLPPDLVLDPAPEGPRPAVVPTPAAAAPQRDDDTLIASYDWVAAEQDAATFDGFRPVVPVTASPAPDQQPDHNTAAPTNGHAPDLPDNNGSDPVHRNGITFPTPIFDDLASAWFQVSPSPPPLHTPPPSAEASKGTFLSHLEEKAPSSQSPDELARDWNFSSDQARRQAEEVAAAEPESFNSAGLPVRTPQAHLVAGSVDPEKAAEPPELRRDPVLSRTKLTRFQEGLRQGRGHDAVAPSQRVQSPEPFTGAEDRVEWDLGSDHTADQVENTLKSEPADYTSAGLPQRTPRARLVPGAANDSATAEAVRARNADVVRGRLQRFQQGAREGKHTLREQR